jgi:hypothetical protein
MSVFICYSHQDKNFVEKLSIDLVENKVHVWLDEWELQIGDSLIEKIQDAISECEALLVVLSKKSLESEWFKKELKAGISRELEEKNVLVIPLIIDDCEIPLFLKDKKYADFSANYDEAFKSTLASIAKFTNKNLGRFKLGEFFNDFHISWGLEGEFFKCEIYVISFPPKDPYSILTTLEIYGNEVVTEKFFKLLDKKIDYLISNTVFGYITGFMADRVIIMVDDNEIKEIPINFQSKSRPDVYSGMIRIRRLGEDTGRIIRFDLRETLKSIFQTYQSRSKKLTEEELISYFGIMGTFEN